MGIALDTRVQQSAGIMHTDLGDQVVMMDVDAGAYFGLDAVGARVWDLASEPVELSAVVSVLLDEFDVERAQCESAVAAFAGDLVESGMLTIVED